MMNASVSGKARNGLNRTGTLARCGRRRNMGGNPVVGHSGSLFKLFYNPEMWFFIRVKL